jgi:hypothetical protein
MAKRSISATRFALGMFLKEQFCSEAQDYHFSRPLTALEFAEWTRRTRHSRPCGATEERSSDGHAVEPPPVRAASPG